ncbi:MAG TPA: RHS repeat-associated core domain-containing protein, partial [Verrucomicrobiae bacterium]|nr:RHS repeat-associated core domain-containing protein [Verrucomicrobiae bacterium]
GDSQAAEYAFSYDSPSQNAYGRLAAVSFGGYSWIYSYTPGGLVSSKSLRLTQGSSSATLTTSYQYDNEGKVLTMTSPTSYPPNPSGGGYTEAPGQTYTYSYDLMGRPAGLVQGGDPATTWVSNVQYGPANELLQIQIKVFPSSQQPAQYVEHRTYNSRLQLTAITAQQPNMNLQYSYSPNQNNGQITQFRDTVSGEQVSYAYDSLNRLVSATAASGAWGQSYTYDGYGNLLEKTVTQGSAPRLSVAVAPATNRVIGVTYDANGNVIQEMNGTRLVYDAFNRARKVTFLAECNYVYGPDNERVETNCTDTGGPFIVLYGPDGRRLGAYSPSADSNGRLYFSGAFQTVYFAGRPINVSTGKFLALDRLGSMRLSKTTQTTAGYYPYGEEQQASTTEGWNFATYYRHPGIELDYAVNRYYSPRLGRFISPDPYRTSAGLENPQSWNRYAYVLNDPVNFYDPDGLLEARPRSDYPDFGSLGPRAIQPTRPMAGTLQDWDDIHPVARKIK